MQTRIENLGKKKIYIFDDVFNKDEIDAFYEYVSDLPFKKVEKSTVKDDFPIFSVDFDTKVLENEIYVGKKARDLLKIALANGADQYQLNRGYINLSQYGDVEFPHYDCGKDKEDYTVLYYVNNSWDYRYGGETLFYDNKDSRISISPKPGRFAIFPGNIEHTGGVPTRICKKARLSLALKFNKKSML